MLTPGVHNFTLYQGTTLRKVFNWKQPNGDPVNLTGYSARAQLRLEKKTAATPALDLTVLNGGIIIVPLQGSITMYATPAQTELPGEKYLYDLELQDPLGDVVRLVEGVIIVSRGVTR